MDLLKPNFGLLIWTLLAFLSFFIPGSLSVARDREGIETA